MGEALSKDVPPVEAAYQSITSPEPGVADKLTVPDPQRLPPVTPGAGGKVLIVAVTAVRVADMPHPVRLRDSA